MRKAFTMIELVFAIVIVGILAAIAIPKLATTTNDAKGAKIANSLSVCVMDAGSYYMKKGTFGNRTQAGGNQTQSCKVADKCFNFTEIDSNGSLRVESDTSQKSQECLEAQRIANRNLLVKSHIINF
jgi:general secretion pathway protein G